VIIFLHFFHDHELIDLDPLYRKRILISDQFSPLFHDHELIDLDPLYWERILISDQFSSLIMS